MNTLEELRSPIVAPPSEYERLHHKYGMSKLNYLDACAGFTSREAEANEVNEAAEDGTRLHEIMSELASKLKQQAGNLTARQILPRLDLSTVTEDELVTLEYCCDEIDFWMKRSRSEMWPEIKYEIQVSIWNPDGETKLNHGHLDLLIFLTQEVAVLIDYKFGWLPVPPAELNLQGIGYAVACFQQFTRLEKIASVFVQPKLHRTTRHVLHSDNLPEMYERIRGVIARCESPDKTLRPGVYCDYCAAAPTCTALVKAAHTAVVKYEGLPLPDVFDGLAITTADQACVALYCINRLEKLIESGGIKAKALEMAQENGGYLEYAISPTEKITVTVHQKKKDREANSPALIAEALKEVLTPEQVLGCCKPSITALETVFAEVYVERARELHGEKITKKAAKEILDSTLRSEGLVSQADGMIEWAKVRLEKTTNQIENGEQNGKSNTQKSK